MAMTSMNADLGDTRSGQPRIDARAVVSPEAKIGAGCTIASGAVLHAEVILEANVEVGPNVVFVAAMKSEDLATSRVEHGVSIGANATIYPGLTLASRAVICPGSVVTRSVPPRAIVQGNPATIVGYADTEASAGATPYASGSARGVEKTVVAGVTVHTFPAVPDLRGNLTVGEFDKEIPFVPLRYFMVFGVPSKEVRGEHAHRECHQLLICVRGSCAVVADDGTRRVEVPLDAPNRGLYLPPMTWGIQYKYSHDAMLLVFASHRYDPADYIRIYSDFIASIERK